MVAVVEQNVGRLDVAVDDPFAMDIIERLADLINDVENLTIF